jgi:uncharacterized protein
MVVFVDTSALYALLDGNDAKHEAARETWTGLLRRRMTLVTTNYILVETAALLQNRIGLQAVRSLHEDIAPLLSVEFCDLEAHQSAMEAVLAASRRKLSLVDCLSFLVMRRKGVRQAFCFDAHFAWQGFETTPPSAV